VTPFSRRDYIRSTSRDNQTDDSSQQTEQPQGNG
jgi:hypothetical protein